MAFAAGQFPCGISSKKTILNRLWPKTLFNCITAKDAEFAVRDADHAIQAPANNSIGLTPENLKANFLPGIKPVLELLQSEPERIDRVFIRKGRRDKLSGAVMDLCRERQVRFTLLEDAAFTRLYRNNSQSVLARLFDAGFIPLESLLEFARGDAHGECLPVLLALDQVADPGNAGALARTLYALGGAGLIITAHQSAFLGGAAQKASAGALHKLPVAKVSNLAQALDKAKNEGYTIYGGSAQAAAFNVFHLEPVFPAVLVLGNEEKGLRQHIAARCSTLVRIPMYRSFDSLNVAQAGAIILAQLTAGAF
jgi:23S rRNA (guanosine2251-2'-O)-methyltransferase